MSKVEPRDETIQIRVTKSEKQALKQLALDNNDTLSNICYPQVQRLLGQKPEVEELPDFLND